MTTFNKKFGCLLLIEQPAYRSLQWANPKSFVTSAVGAAGGNTIISTTLGSYVATNDGFVGHWVECISATNAQNIGLRRRLTAFDDITSTWTCDKFPAQVSAGDVFALMLPPNPFWADDVGGSTTLVKDASRTEVDDFWNGTAQEGGPYLEAIAADNVPKTAVYLITDFAQALGAVSAAVGVATVIGDLFEAWLHIETLDNAPLECTQEDIPREVYQGTYDTPKNIKGNRAAQGTINVGFRGPGSGREGLHTESHRIMKCSMDVVEDGGDLTVNGAGTVDSIPYDAGVAVVGSMYLTEAGDMFMCTAAGTPAVPSPSLTTVPADNSIVHALTTYKPTSDGELNYALAAKQFWGDGAIDYIWGLVPGIQMSGELGGVLKLSFPVQGADWARLFQDSAGAISRAWQAKRPSVNPVRLGGMRCVLSSTAYTLKSFTFDLGLEFYKRVNLAAPNETDGYTLVGYKPSGQLVAVLDGTNRQAVDDFLSATQKTLLVQAGMRAGYPGAAGIWSGAISYTTAVLGDDGGKLTVSMDWKANPPTTAGLPTLAIAMG